MIQAINDTYIAIIMRQIIRLEYYRISFAYIWKMLLDLTLFSDQ